MSKPYVHSHTSIKEFEQCPRKFEAKRILKLYPYEQSEAARYGDEVHKALEDYTNLGAPLPEQHAQFLPVIQAVLAKPGRHKAELSVGVRRDLSPCDFFDKKVWLRGKIDHIAVDDEDLKAWVVDWKTGKNKYPDFDQMTLMSLFTFAHYGHLRQVNSAIIFLLYKDLKKSRMVIDDVEKQWWKLKEKTAKIEKAIEVGQFPPKPGPLCPWCEHTACEHHPKH
jgi:RecB family exonuclease